MCLNDKRTNSQTGCYFGANNISNQKNSINDLNIFPVPDGDTGTNMSMTVNAAVAALEDFDGTCAGDAAGITASAMLRGARGNSGVITSLIFRGFAQGLKDIEEVDGKILPQHLESVLTPLTRLL